MRTQRTSGRSRGADRLIAYHRRLLEADLQARELRSREAIEPAPEKTRGAIGKDQAKRGGRPLNDWAKHEEALQAAGAQDDATARNRRAWSALQKRTAIEETAALEEEAQQRPGPSVLAAGTPAKRTETPQTVTGSATRPIEGGGRRSIPKTPIRRGGSLGRSDRSLHTEETRNTGRMVQRRLGAQASGPLPFRRHAHGSGHGSGTFD